MNYRNGVLHIGEISTADLIGRFGSPLYVYDAEIIRRQVGRIRQAFSGLDLQPFYAMKANSNLTLLRLLAAEGFGCDSVSPGEVFLARHGGFQPEMIWFTCSNVSDEDLLTLADPSVTINVNSRSEIDRCIRLKLSNPIAIRVNPDIGAGHHHDVITAGFNVKFGIELDEVDAARQSVEDNGLLVTGLHAHIGSGIAEIDPLLESARRLLTLGESFEHLKWINFGGGISAPYRPGEPDFPIDAYGKALTELAAKVLRKRNIRAIVEPGRFVVAESGILLTTVTSKNLRGGFEWIGCDTGFNHLARPSRYGAYHHIVNATNGQDSHLRTAPVTEEGEAKTIVAGNLCESGDVFTRDLEGVRPRALPPIRIGDVLGICDAGAYGFSMASHYNARLLPPEILVQGSEIRLIRERQVITELLKGQP